MKISDNPVKVTNPGYKTVHRLYDKDGKAIADLITLADETIDTTKPLTIFDPVHPYKRMTLTDFTERELLVPLFVDGKRVYDVPTIQESKAYCKREKDSMWEEYLRILNPHIYKVDLSDKLYDLKKSLLSAHKAPTV